MLCPETNYTASCNTSTILAHLRGFIPTYTAEATRAGLLRPRRRKAYHGEQIGQPVEMMHLCAMGAVLQFAQRIASGVRVAPPCHDFVRQSTIFYDFVCLTVALKPCWREMRWT